MTNLKKSLQMEQAELNRYRKQLQKNEKDEKDMPEGSLRVAVRHGHPQYFQYRSGSKNGGSYIPQSQTELIRQLAQKDYEKKVNAYIEERLPQIDRLLETYTGKGLDDIYLSEVQERRKWVTPVRQTWEEIANAWAAKPYRGLPIQNTDDIILTNRGEQVRSKSEKILADLFDKNGLCYKYECPLNLPPYGLIYPDFTLLSPFSYREVYWEHLGRMDDPDYAAKAAKKINLYEKNHIYPGERLILTFEANHMILDTQIAQQLIDRYLIQ